MSAELETGFRARLRRLWRKLLSPSAKISVAGLVVPGVLTGVVAAGGFNIAMEHTNTLEFCISCHEMQQTVYQEYKKSTHYANASGVRAICSDCHVPRDWSHKVWRKIQASGELFHKVRGSIDTPEKFEAKRAELAQRVWDGMKANDSRECRHCHSYAAMDFHKQAPRAAEKMEPAPGRGETCIDCHQGIVHKLPPRDD